MLMLSINPEEANAKDTDTSSESNRVESKIVELNVRKDWFSVDRPMPSDWNPPATIYATESRNGVLYAGTLTYAGTANRDGQVVAVYTGDLYEDTGYTPLSLRQLDDNDN